MPGLKRLHRPAEHDLSDAGSETDTSKRRRTSSPERSGDVSYDEDDDISDEEREEYTQLQAAKRAAANDKEEAGSIEEITMVNFMCHKHLTIKPGPNINFVIGHNGSGKSAALTALVLSLGAKASSTNRGGSLKSFIMTGQDQTTLIVKIKNTGDTAYRHEDYGNAIIVERTFNRAGTSGFKIKNASGSRVLSTKKTDVDEITDWFGMQMENPLTVLSQDQARQFLNNSSPADKYKFFMKGVQLEQLEQDYKLIEDSLNTIIAALPDREADLAVLHQNAMKAKGNFLATNKIKELQERQQKYRMKMVWAQVVSQERKLSMMNQELAELQEKIQQATDNLEESTRIYDQADLESEQATVAVNAANEELNPLLEEQESIKSGHENLMQETRDLQAQQRQVKDAIKKAKEKIAKRQNDIAEEERRLADQNGASFVQRQQELLRLQDQAKAASLKHSDHVVKDPELLQIVKQAQEASKKHDEGRGPMEREVKETETQLQALQSQGSRPVNAYGPKMPALLKAIAQEGGFQSKPIGPVGNHVHLKKPEWSSILEQFFGTSLNTFIVHSRQDQERLQGLMRRMGCEYPVSITNTSLIDVAGHEPDNRFETVLKVLDIDNPVARKLLIINHAIEQVILVPDMREARDLMMSGQRIPYVKQCYSFSHQDQNNGERYAYGLSGASTSEAKGYQGTPRMQTQQKDLIEHQKHVLQQRRQRLHEYDNRRTQVRRDIEQANAALTRHRREAKDLKVAANAADEAVADFQAKLEADSPQQGRLEQLRSEVEKIEKDKTQSEETYGQTVEGLEANKTKRSRERQTTNEIENKVNAAKAKVSNATIALEHIRRTRSNALVEKNRLYADLESLRVECDGDDGENIGLQANILSIKELIARFIPAASSHGPRVDIEQNETFETCQAAFHRLEADIEAQQRKLGGSIAELEKLWQDAKKDYDQAKKQLDQETEIKDQMSRSLYARRDKWEQFRKQITFRARIDFEMLLIHRDFQGRLRIDHKARTLDIEIQPDKTQGRKGKRAAKTLSGGEKSFSQICLIVALWEAIGAPIRCLDEFDVFMDNVNRDLAMKLLIEAARSSVGRQYILITPQSMSNVAAGPDVKVHKMQDPDRTGQQTTLTAR